MDEMVNCMVNAQRTYEDRIKELKQSLRAVSKRNRTMSAIIIAGSIAAAKVYLHIKEQNEKIESMSKELEELKNMKGE